MHVKRPNAGIPGKLRLKTSDVAVHPQGLQVLSKPFERIKDPVKSARKGERAFAWEREGNERGVIEATNLREHAAATLRRQPVRAVEAQPVAAAPAYQAAGFNLLGALAEPDRVELGYAVLSR